MRLLAASLVLSSLAAVGCSNNVTQGQPSGTTTGDTGTGTGGGPSFDAGATVTSYTTGMGPISLAPGDEETNCIVIPLGNTEGGWVRRFRADLSTGSHHMIVYTTSQTTPNTTPTPCQALGGILSGDHPVFIAQQATATLEFPNDENGTPVGFQIQPNQMLKIEFHTINTTQAPLMATGKAYLDTVPLSTTITASDMAFWGTEYIKIPANGTFDTGVLFQAALEGTSSFAVTTHQHHLGTEMKIWYSAAEGDTSNKIADSKDWNNPELVMLNPAITYPAGAGKGLSFQCTWNNPTPNEVQFGESFNDEMCFLWHYYYPSQGFQVCSYAMVGGSLQHFCK